MKILQINKFFYLKGGSETHMFELSDALKKRGHEVAFFSMTDKRNVHGEWNKYFIDNVDYKKFNFLKSFKVAFDFLYNFSAKKKLQKLINDFKPDIAHLHNIYHQLSPSIVDVLRKNNIPILMTLHDYKIICPNYQLFSKNKVCTKCRGGKFFYCALNCCVKNSFSKSFLAMLEAYLHNRILKTYDKVDLFIAPSEFIKDVFVNFGFDEKKIKVKYNFVPVFGGSFKEDKEEEYVLYYGRLSPEKGVDILLEAAGELPDVQLKIVGEGEQYQEIKHQIMERGLVNRVELLGFKAGSELRNLILGAKVIVIPSVWYENMPYALLEAMALGKIVLVSRIGGLGEVITNEENGFSFEAGNVNGLKRRICQAISLPESKKRDMSKAAREFANNLSLNNYLGGLEGLYSEVIELKR